MCYSAMVEQDYRLYKRTLHSDIDFEAFLDLFVLRLEDDSIRIPKAMEANFDSPQSPIEERIKDAIEQYRAKTRAKLETALFAQKKRLADAERTLATKTIGRALENQRIATDKIVWNSSKLADLGRTDLRDIDSRIFPMWYAPIVTNESGHRVLRPMRYTCRLNGKPENYDRRYPGTYNARRDNLQGFWKGVFGRNHALTIASSFYENVALHDFERRSPREGEKPQNVILHFNPQTAAPMLVACLWDRWEAPGKRSLYSFAAITDEPPPEVAQAGHDRCIIPLQLSAVDAWLNPIVEDRAVLDRLLDRRERPYYEHQLAA